VAIAAGTGAAVAVAVAAGAGPNSALNCSLVFLAAIRISSGVCFLLIRLTE
jgi:hypothetical protein